MKPNSIASGDENTEENSEENSVDNEEFNDLDDDNDEENYEINNDYKQHDTSNISQQHRKESNSKRKSKIKFERKRKCRTTFTKNQLNALECEFLKSNFISNDKIDTIMEITGLDSRIIKVIANLEQIVLIE